jgi:hypothetical protein
LNWKPHHSELENGRTRKGKRKILSRALTMKEKDGIAVTDQAHKVQIKTDFVLICFLR